MVFRNYTISSTHLNCPSDDMAGMEIVKPVEITNAMPWEILKLPVIRRGGHPSYLETPAFLLERGVSK